MLQFNYNPHFKNYHFIKIKLLLYLNVFIYVNKIKNPVVHYNRTQLTISFDLKIWYLVIMI